MDVEQKEDGSFITHSHLRLQVTFATGKDGSKPLKSGQIGFISCSQAGAGPDLEAVCYGTNEVLGGDSVALVHNVEIISPPGVPTISGVQPHSSVQVFLPYLLVSILSVSST